MGNRAVITASTDHTKGVGIYLHWNGGAESVLAFLDTAKQLGYRSPNMDETYGMARLCGLICLFMGVRDNTGIGIGDLSQLDCDNYDNGVFVVGNDWQVIDRWGKGSEPIDVNAVRASKQYNDMIKALSDNLDKAEGV